ncbi:hypothetical protein NEOLI_001537 [Neolecta irregularis DAH-3]|uniref:Uncharacterized protein n=1 Tax=Neolecta irregularis (strain DAH-3) TaxID=1198029 RepID=A0A1U7LV28_NEOID|nr:hypothetical protein NEOLI_001537 [Neolecta irregularis DAH-3]|eukprot:OLL26402.1 hypothetical protein NEOLI_001537 [Neolecta irregularis DAH-3]
MVMKCRSALHKALDHSDQWFLLTAGAAFLCYCSQAMFVPMIQGLKTREDFRRLFTTQIFFTCLSITGVAVSLVYLLQGILGFSRHVVLVWHNLYCMFEMMIAFTRIPRQLFTPTHYAFIRYLMLLSQFVQVCAIPWHIIAATTESKGIRSIATYSHIITCIFFIITELSTLLASKKMLREIPPDFEQFTVTRTVLLLLVEANSMAMIAGIYSLLYAVFGKLTVGTICMFAGGMAFKTYAYVFRLTRECREATRSREDSNKTAETVKQRDSKNENFWDPTTKIRQWDVLPL